jgi:threonine synthase
MTTPITYISTRGQSPELSFEEVLLRGLAPDGGLYVPSHLPHYSITDLMRLSTLPYADLAYEVIAPFVGEALPQAQLKTIIDESYASFRHRAVAPIMQLHHQHYALELFHGPTLAFKDFALQFLGRVMDAVLQRRGEKLVILGATSGDTGSAAIAGCQGRANMDIVILYPEGRVSDVQRRQMTTVMDANVHCLAVDGTFDDCQHIVKTLFVDEAFRTAHPLGAVNSINWTRIMAQIVYYFYAAFQLGAPTRKLAFSVPTGNFGDIYAGFLAKNMGLPIEHLIIASNKNNILTRCVTSGQHAMQGVEKSLSPSMDIEISSNFERALFDVYSRDSAAIAALMGELKASKSFHLPPAILRKLQQEFSAFSCDDGKTADTMRQLYEESGIILDPHTAVGYYAALQHQLTSGSDATYVTLATAHPAKFPDAVAQATGTHPALPAYLSDLLERKERFTSCPNNSDAVKAFISNL